MQDLALKTDGKYFEINEKKNDVERMINTINSIEGELRDSKKVDAKSNKYYYFLWGALILLLLDSFFQVRIFRI